MLDTEKDLIRRKQLSMSSYQSYKSKLESNKISLKVRMKILMYTLLVFSFITVNYGR